MFEINFIAIIVAAIVAFIVGFLMHGPVAGKLWMRLANIVPTGKEKFSDMVPQMIWNFVANIVIAFVMSVLYIFTTKYFMLSSQSSIFLMKNGVEVQFWICVILMWLFTVAGSSMDVIWMGKSFKLWVFDSISSLLVLVSIGIVIAL